MQGPLVLFRHHGDALMSQGPAPGLALRSPSHRQCTKQQSRDETATRKCCPTSLSLRRRVSTGPWPGSSPALFIWALRFEFHRIFMSQERVFLSPPHTHTLFKNVKTILSSQVVQKQVMGWFGPWGGIC